MLYHLLQLKTNLHLEFLIVIIRVSFQKSSVFSLTSTFDLLLTFLRMPLNSLYSLLTISPNFLSCNILFKLIAIFVWKGQKTLIATLKKCAKLTYFSYFWLSTEYCLLYLQISSDYYDIYWISPTPFLHKYKWCSFLLFQQVSFPTPMLHALDLIACRGCAILVVPVCNK